MCRAGVATPSDPIDSVQYTPAEIRAAVTEATHRGTYVAAHAYLPEAIAMAVSEGVMSIEHGNLIDDETAQLVAESDAIMVPTLVTYKAMNDLGPSFGLPRTNLEKNSVVYESGLVLTREGHDRRHHIGIRHRPDRRDAAHAEPGTRHPGRGRAPRGRAALDVGGQRSPVSPGGAHRRRSLQAPTAT